MTPAPASVATDPSPSGITPAKATLSLVAAQQPQVLARMAGGLFLITFVTSIPALVLC